MKVLITGAAGFIGNALALRLLERGDAVIGIDNLNDYYDPEPERGSSGPHRSTCRLYRCAHGSGRPPGHRRPVCADTSPTRWSIWPRRRACAIRCENPSAYVDTNLVGFIHILEGCRSQRCQTPGLCLQQLGVRLQHQDAVFGARQRRSSGQHLCGHQESQRTDGAHLQPPVPAADHGLRFFTVYGPWGRPDMALFLFTRKMLAGEPIDVFNYGKHRRDFTYIDDIVEGVIRTLDRIPQPNPDWSGDHPDSATSTAPYALYNIGNNQPVELMHYIEVLEDCLGMQGEQEPAAAAAGRRAGYLCRCAGPGARRRLQAGYLRRRRRGQLRGLVPGLLQGVS